MARATPTLERGVPVTAPGNQALAAPGRPTALARGRRKPERIGLLGLFGSGNSGNDGSLEAMITFLRRVRPDAELICFCACSAGARDRIATGFEVAAVPFALPKPANPVLRLLDRLSLRAPRQLASLVRAILQTRRVDVLIIPGTGILDDFQEGPLGMPLVLFGWCLAAKLRGAPIAFVSIGAGPIQHPISRQLMKSAIALADYRSYRDTVSKVFMQGIGFDTGDDAVYPDLAFRLPAPSPTRRRGADDGRLVVGVGVMTYFGWRNEGARGAAIYAAYRETITNFVLWLLDRGHSVRVLMGAEGDRRAVADLMTGVAIARPDLPQGRLSADPVASLHDLMQQIADTDVVVATRFHNVVCALKLGKPTVSLGYAAKNDVLMAEMGLGRFCQHIEHLRLDLLIEQFTGLVADRARYERTLRDVNFAYQERLSRQELRLASRLLD